MPGERLNSRVVARLLDRVVENVNEFFGEGEDREETFRKLFLEDSDGCLPVEYIGEDLLESLYGKYNAVAAALISELEDRYRTSWRVFVVIQPSYEDATRVYYIYEPEELPRGRGFQLHRFGSEPWHYWFNSLEDLKQHLWEEYTKLEEGYKWARWLQAKSDTTGR